ncbi:hypothetical protein Ssi02_76910 [Sinosporangium siamense]|uniref:ADP-ribosylation/crystallin J1 n=1 Tax=Sinosporangium siamense TaxID=1367973 RepID=A0A919RR06_9ACTN|nr:hypothetical protein Ssi02_76910 [Sinosporangium siamense]
MPRMETTILWRPAGPEELELVRRSGWREWPPRLPEQPIFYPVLNEDYAVKIARDWNVPHSGAGYVTRFEVRTEFLERYPVRQAGGRTILELWVPAKPPGLQREHRRVDRGHPRVPPGVTTEGLTVATEGNHQGPC